MRRDVIGSIILHVCKKLLIGAVRAPIRFSKLRNFEFPDYRMLAMRRDSIWSIILHVRKKPHRRSWMPEMSRPIQKYRICGLPVPEIRGDILVPIIVRVYAKPLGGDVGAPGRFQRFESSNSRIYGPPRNGAESRILLYYMYTGNHTSEKLVA